VATMSKMKCPFCQQEMEKTEWQGGDIEIWCSHCDIIGSEKLWQALDRTKKQLEIAVDALKVLEKELYYNNAKQTGHIADSVISIPSLAIYQIQELDKGE